MYFVHNDSFIKALMVYTDCHMALCQWVHIKIIIIIMLVSRIGAIWCIFKGKRWKLKIFYTFQYNFFKIKYYLNFKLYSLALNAKLT